MIIRECLNCGYYDEDCPKDYIVEISTKKLKQWIEQEGLDLLDFETSIEKKLAIYNILEQELTKDINDYHNFTVILK